MSSFSKMGAFPAGYFRGVAKWLLRNRRDLPARITALSAEVDRIGFIRMTFEQIIDAEGNTRATEKPIGFSVTQGSTLAHLVRAYIANGGNPFNISKFLMPNSSLVSETAAGGLVVIERYPGGGIVAPKSAEYNEPLPVIDNRETEDDSNNPSGDDANFTAPSRSGYEAYTGGQLNTDRYYPTRMGGRMDRGAWDSDTVVRMMHDIRRWANHDINRLQDMEWRIIKQMDLREQLIRERDEIITGAFGGLLDGVPPLDPEAFRQERLVPVIIDEMEKLIAQTNPATAEIVGSGANSQTGFLIFVFPDVPSEALETL